MASVYVCVYVSSFSFRTVYKGRKKNKITKLLKTNYCMERNRVENIMNDAHFLENIVLIVENRDFMCTQCVRVARALKISKARCADAIARALRARSILGKIF